MGDSPRAEDLPIGPRRIVAERMEQIELHGWTPAHDDAHGRGELTVAGGCYAALAALQLRGEVVDLPSVPTAWPWDAPWWKPSADPRKNLMKAGALFAAEIDRLHRRGVRHG